MSNWLTLKKSNCKNCYKCIRHCPVKSIRFSGNQAHIDGNFIEGMACIGGCIGGAGCLTHGMKDKAEVDKYGREAFEKTITDAISLLK